MVDIYLARNTLFHLLKESLWSRNIYTLLVKPVKQYTAKFNAKVALEATKDDKPLSEISSKYDVQPNQVRQWKKELLNNLPDIFFGKRKKMKQQQEHYEAKLFEEIGRLKIEVD